MAEGFEPYHVPQQSRRDKLRVNTQGCVENLQSCAPLVPLYDPSLISSDFLTPAANVRQSFNLGTNSSVGVKEEGINLMGFAGGVNTNNHMFVDPSVHMNPSSIQEINGNPYAYYRGFLDQSFVNSGQSLSLSLSSNQSHLPLELNLQRYDSESLMFCNNNNNTNNKVSGGYFVASNGCPNSVELSKSSVPLGPFTGYASVLKGSRFLKPAQQLLEEICDVGRGIYAEKNGVDSSLLDPPPLETGIVEDSLSSVDGSEQTRKKSRLLSMLDEVYKRYKQYYQQMQAAVAAFESVAGLSGAAPFANLALKAMSKHFRSLKDAITDQLQFTSKSHGKMNSEKDETQRLENSGRGTYGQRPFQSSGFVDQPVWRPQRGLPERAVTVLRAWLFEHFLHPYPTDTDKIMLAKQTGLSRNQVSNWFINARVRLWKPMVEEIHMLETRQSQKPSQTNEQPPPPNTLNDHLPTSCSAECENPSTSIPKTGEFHLKRSRDEANETPRGNEGPMRLPYDNLYHNNPHHLGIGVSNGGVSLTLGLHQNGVGLSSDSFPMNAARHFGLDSPGEGYVVSGFAAQNRQFGRGHVMDGQLMHDFVG